ncbi:MAG TPA: hypothetical protein DCL54_00315 [Alphaproteobacteria bacterium]|nr:hypothetical protein [Alphaproteobacteria bacterium]
MAAAAAFFSARRTLRAGVVASAAGTTILAGLRTGFAALAATAALGIAALVFGLALGSAALAFAGAALGFGLAGLLRLVSVSVRSFLCQRRVNIP